MIDYAEKLAKIEKRKRELAIKEARIKQSLSKQKRKAENQAKIICGAVFLKNGTKEDIEKCFEKMTPDDRNKVLIYLKLTRPKDFPSTSQTVEKKK